MPKEDGYKNLIPGNMRSPEEMKEIGRKGGRKYAENRERYKTMQDCMRALLDITVSKEKARKEIGDIAEFASDNPTLMEILNLVQVREAQQGNTKSYELVRDTAGFKPVDQIQTDVNIMSDSDKALLEKVAKRTGVDQGKT